MIDLPDCGPKQRISIPRTNTEKSADNQSSKTIMVKRSRLSKSVTKDCCKTMLYPVNAWYLMFLLMVGYVAVSVIVGIHVLWKRTPPELEWWKTDIIYQIYPRSFMDSNGDGIGDLKGIISRLDYFVYLNVKVIWISPVYRSPMKDFGYDVSNFTDIDPIFGDISDMVQLIKAAHSKGLKVILDFVPNHTSDQHPWFVKSLANNKKYADYYIWADGKRLPNGTRIPPSNWISRMRNSAWEWSDDRGQFYYHAYLKEQPDLNYRSKDVQEDMKNVLRFWLNHGIDGFRIDAISQLFEDVDLIEDEPPSNLTGIDPTHWRSLEHIHTHNKMTDITKVLEGWRSVVDEYVNIDGKSRLLLVEANTKSIEQHSAWYNTAADMPFYFGMTKRDINPSCGGTCISTLVNNLYRNLPKGAWPNFVVGTHDVRRIQTRKGKEYTDVFNMLLLTLWGTPTTYYGEEIGMEDVEPTFSEAVDPKGILYGEKRFLKFSRDPERSPMQWSDSFMAGFSNSAKTWLPVGPNYHTVNVEVQKATTGFSSIKLYRTLAELRERPAFRYGKIDNVVVNSNIFSYIRFATNVTTYLIILNFGNSTTTENYSGEPVNTKSGIVMAITRNTGFRIGDTLSLSAIKLDPAQGLVIKLL